MKHRKHSTESIPTRYGFYRTHAILSTFAIPVLFLCMFCAVVRAQDACTQVDQWERTMHQLFLSREMKMYELDSLNPARLAQEQAPPPSPHKITDLYHLSLSPFAAPCDAITKQLRTKLNSQWREIRYLTVLYLQVYDDKSVYPLLFARLKEEPDEDVKLRVLRTLTELQYEPAAFYIADEAGKPLGRMSQAAEIALKAFGKVGTAALVSSLPHTVDPDTLRRRIRFMLQLPADDSLSKLIPYLTNASEHDDVRSAACEVLRHFARNEILPALVAILAEKRIRSTNLCLAAKEALQQLRDDGVTAIIRGIENPVSEEHRANLIWALMRPKAEAAIPVLTLCLDDDDPDVRRHAITALQEVEGYPAAVKLLRFLDDKEMQSSALLALEKLAKRSFAQDIDACRAWWLRELKDEPTGQ